MSRSSTLKAKLSAAQAKNALGFKSQLPQMRLLTNLLHTLPVSGEMSEDELAKKYETAIEMLLELRPGDGLEGMLATQMIACHEAALNCLSRAQNPQNSFEGRHENLKQAQKLLSLYIKQMQALDKHRGKGQQSVTVKHVHVESGGQAVVGNVTTGRGEKPSKTPSEAGAGTAHKQAKSPSIEHEPGETVPVVGEKKARKTKRRR